MIGFVGDPGEIVQILLEVPTLDWSLGYRDILVRLSIVFDPTSSCDIPKLTPILDYRNRFLI